MSGVITETATDTGGGKNIGAVNNGGWIEFDNLAAPRLCGPSAPVSRPVPSAA